MTFTYLSSGPGSSDRSWVRLTIGDNSSADVQLEDEDIDTLLSSYGSKERAAIAGARAVAARFTRKVDKTVGRLRIANSQAADALFKLADQLEKQIGRLTGGTDGIYAGGISLADKRTEEQDADRVDPAFVRHQFDNVGLHSSDSFRRL